MARCPACVIVTGRPGSGKTTLAGKLAERLWMPVVSRDAIKEGYVNTQGDLAARRHLRRGLDLPARVFYHGDRRVRHFLETGDVLAPGVYEPPACDAPVIEVCTTDGYTPSLDEVVASISGFVRSNPKRAASR